MKGQKDKLFEKFHMYGLMAMGVITALFFFFKILFG